MGKPQIADSIQAEVVRLYQENLGGTEISAQLGIGTTTVNRILKRRGVAIRPPLAVRAKQRIFTDLQEEEIARRYANRESTGDLAKEYDTTERTIRTVVLRQGGSIHTKGGQYREFTDTELEDIRVRCSKGQSQEHIASALQTSQATVSRVIRSLNISTLPRMQIGSNHGRWKGGRIVTSGGYVKVLVPSSDPLRPLADRQGYVLEHRLVMARHLGRPLLPSETIHHIDGDKTNNVPENLQLRQGSHGAGVHHRCLDCGSMNVETVEI